MDTKDLAQKILDEIGGEQNVLHLTHCATRLRFNLKDTSKANLTAISNFNGVLKAQNQNGQIQIIIGAKVRAVYEELEKIVSIPTSNNSVEVVEQNKKGKVSAVIEVIAGIFSPVIPMLIACGLIKAFSSMLVNFKLIDPDSSFMVVLALLGDLVFYFLPFFLAVSAARKFKTNEYLALALAAAYMSPAIINGARAVTETGVKSIDFFGLPILLVDYKSTVIPIILSVWVMSYVYRKVDKVIPDFLKILLTVMIVLGFMVPFQLIALGPIGSYTGVWLADFINWFYTAGGVFAAFFWGTAKSLLTMLGMHYALAPIMIQEIAQNGSSVILVAGLTSNLAQAGAALGVFLVVKNKAMKTVAASSSFSAFLGITEPAMFGVNLKYKRPFFIALFSSGIGAAFLSLFHTSGTAYVPQSIITLPVFQADSFIYVIFGALISAGLSCVLTYFFGVPKELNVAGNTEGTAPNNEAIVVGEEGIFSPLEGEVVKLSNINDQVFSKGLLGQGVAIRPIKGRVYAPFNGNVQVMYTTKHAIGLKSTSGIELLIHVGIDTVNLGGKYYSNKVQQGQDVKAGDLLLEFDLEAIKAEGYDTITPIIITNSNEYRDIIIDESKNIKRDSVLLSLNREVYGLQKEVVSVS